MTKRKCFGALGMATLAAVAAVCLVGPVRGAVKDQEEKAKAQATAKDLPAIAKADHVTIAGPSGDIAADVKDAKLLAAIVAGLKVSDVPLSSGMTYYTLVFYKDKEKIRTVWVYESGGWGVNPPEGSGIICGKDESLVKAIKAALPN